MNPQPLLPSDDPGHQIDERGLLKLIADALEPLSLDLASERDKRVYLAYLAARQAEGLDDTLKRRLEQLRDELGL